MKAIIRRLNLAFAITVSMFCSLESEAAAWTDWSLRPINWCDQLASSTPPLGTECISRRGTYWKRVQNPSFYWGWQNSSDGKIWLDMKGTNEDLTWATQSCDRLSADIPRLNDFRNAISRGGATILFGMSDKQNFWTSSKASSNPNSRTQYLALLVNFDPRKNIYYDYFAVDSIMAQPARVAGRVCTSKLSFIKCEMTDQYSALGTECQSSNGYTFRRVKAENGIMGWEDLEANVVWLDLVKPEPGEEWKGCPQGQIGDYYSNSPELPIRYELKLQELTDHGFLEIAKDRRGKLFRVGYGQMNGSGNIFVSTYFDGTTGNLVSNREISQEVAETAFSTVCAAQSSLVTCSSGDRINDGNFSENSHFKKLIDSYYKVPGGRRVNRYKVELVERNSKTKVYDVTPSGPGIGRDIFRVYYEADAADHCVELAISKVY